MIAKRFRYDREPSLTLNSIQKKMKAQVDLKVDGKEYTFEDVPCLVCNNRDFETLAEKDRYGLYYPVVICKHCGLVQTNPRMDQESYNKFYNIEYRKLYGGTLRPQKDFFQREYMKGGRIFQYLKTILGKEITGSLVVEIGTGAGGSLKYFKEKGNRVLGLDLGKEYVEYGKAHGLDLRVGMAKEMGKARPDLIIYCHVLEHILDPVQEMKDLAAHMGEDSMVYIEVPGIKDLVHSYESDFQFYLNNAHTYHFTLKTLTNVMHKAGLRRVSGDEKISSLWMKGETKRTYDSDYKETVDFLLMIEKRRKNIAVKAYHVMRRAGIATMQKTGMTDQVYRIYYRLRNLAGMLRK